MLAPLVLWAQGPARLDEVAHRAAAVVGTRAATAYGEQVAGDLVAGLVQRDVAVVSGGAYGIDGAAHRAALDCDGVTVAVLAGGLDVAYPSGHSALLHRIGQHGLLFTEYAPGVRPARYRFLTRNRLVAAMAGATVVVEAGLRSGAANTAAWARALGRVVAAVPGPVTSSASAGCHALLRNGAELITRAEHVVELIGHIGELAAEEPHPVTPLDGLGEAERRVYEALPRRGHRRAARGRLRVAARAGAGAAGDARAGRAGAPPGRALEDRADRRGPGPATGVTRIVDGGSRFGQEDTWRADHCKASRLSGPNNSPRIWCGSC